MKPLTSLTLFLPTLALFLYSCSKTNHGSNNTSTIPATLSIDLSTTVADEEVLISDSTGVILLDTMSPYPSPLVATLKTASHRLDVSLIAYDSTYSSYTVTITKAIDPSKWAVLESTGSYDVPFERLTYPSTSSTAVYKNAPAVAATSAMICDDLFGSFLTQPSEPSPGILNVSYLQVSPANYTYLLMVGPGLYNFHLPPSSGPDTADLSHMDTATQVDFSLPSGYTLQSLELNGLTDTNDLSKSVLLYVPNDGRNAPDLEYPHTVVEGMELLASFQNSDGYANYYGYGMTFPSTLNLPVPSNYSVTSSQVNNFSIAFSSISPDYYYTVWTNGKIILTINAPGDSTSLNPQGFLSTLKSKLLVNQSLSGLTLNSLDFTSLTGITYGGVFSLEHNPAALKTQHVPGAIEFYKQY